MAIERTCATCLLCLRQDEGYSNWTVEGTALWCLAGLNPALDGSGEPWREPSPELAAALDVALTCPKYREGAPAWMDVDQEGAPYDKPLTIEMLIAHDYTSDAEAAALLIRHLRPHDSESWRPDVGGSCF